MGFVAYGLLVARTLEQLRPSQKILLRDLERADRQLGVAKR